MGTTIGEAIERGLAAGKDKDAIVQMMALRGIALDKNSDVNQVIPLSIEEYVTSARDKGATRDAILGGLAAHGIMNLGNLTSDQLHRPMPPPREGLTGAEAEELSDHAARAKSGAYNDWRFDDTGGEAARNAMLLQAADLSGAAHSDEATLYAEWLRNRTNLRKTLVSTHSTGGIPIGAAIVGEKLKILESKEPKVSEGAKQTASLINSIANKLHWAKSTGSITGATFSLGLGAAEVFGASRALGYYSGWYKDTPKGKAQIEHIKKSIPKVESQVMANAGKLLAMREDDDAPRDDVPLADIPHLLKTFAPQTSKEQSEYDKFRVLFTKLEGMKEREGELLRQPLVDSYTEQFNKKVDKPWQINHDKALNASKRHQAKVKKARINNHAVTGRMKEEIVDMVSGVAILIKAGAELGGNTAKLAQLAADGVVDVDEAELAAFIKGYKGGVGTFGAIAGFYAAFGDSEESLLEHAQAYPLDTILMLIPVLQVLKGAKVAMATKALDQAERWARSAGVSDEILAAARQADLESLVDAPGMLRRFYDSQIGRNAQGNALRRWADHSLPETMATATKVGGSMLVFGASGLETAVVAGGSGALRSIGRSFGKSAKAQRLTHKLTRQEDASGEAVTTALSHSLFEAEGIRAATSQAGENLLLAGLDPAKFIASSDAAMADFAARMNAVVDADFAVSVAEKKWNATKATEESSRDARAAARLDLVTARREARIKFAKESGFVLPDDPYMAAVAGAKKAAGERRAAFADEFDAAKKYHAKQVKMAEGEILADYHKAMDTPAELQMLRDALHAEYYRVRNAKGEHIAEAKKESHGVYVADRDELTLLRDERRAPHATAVAAKEKQIKDKNASYDKDAGEARSKHRKATREASNKQKERTAAANKAANKAAKGKGASKASRRPKKTKAEQLDKINNTHALAIKRADALLETRLKTIEANRSTVIKKMTTELNKKRKKAKSPGVPLKRPKEKTKIVSYTEARRYYSKLDDERVALAAKEYDAQIAKARALYDEAAANYDIAKDRALGEWMKDPISTHDSPTPGQIRRHRIERKHKDRMDEIAQRQEEFSNSAIEGIAEIQALRSSEFDRALGSAMGLHVDESKYIFNAVAVVKYDAIRGAIRGVDAADTAAGRRLIQLDTGRVGYIDPLDMNSARIIDQANSFPADDIPELFQLIRDVGDLAIDGIEGTAALDASKLAIAGVADAIRTGNSKAIAKAVAKAKKVSTTGRNSLRRLVEEVLGDILLNEHSHSMLIDPGLRRKFANYAADQMASRFGVRSTDVAAGTLKSDLYNMAFDLAQARTVKGGKIVRVDYDIISPAGEKMGKMSELFDDFMLGGHTTKQAIKDARQAALDEALFVVTSAAEARMPMEAALGAVQGMTRKIWEAGPSLDNMAFAEAVYRHVFETGSMPIYFRGKFKDGKHPLSALDIPENADMLAHLGAEALESSRAIALSGGIPRTPPSVTEAAKIIEDAIMSGRAATSHTGKQGYKPGAYVNVHFNKKPARDGIRDLKGAGPNPGEDMGLMALHNPLQPDDLVSLGSSVQKSDDIFVRFEFDDAIGAMLDTHHWLEANNVILRTVRALGATFKWTKTAGNPVNHMTNFKSNFTTIMWNYGIDPITAAGLVAKDARRWKAYVAGDLAGTREGAMMDSLMRQGMPNQSLLKAEIEDFGMSIVHNGRGEAAFAKNVDDLLRRGEWKGHTVPGASRAIRATSRKMDHAYRRYGDEMFKRIHAIRQMEQEAKRLDLLDNGATILLSDISKGGKKGSNTIGTITKNADGSFDVFHRGKLKKGVKDIDAPRNPVMEILADYSSGHANAFFYNLADMGLGMKFLRGYESIAVRPFLSWAVKSLDIPFVKKGMAYRVFMDDIGVMTTSPAANFMLYAEAARRSSRRAALTIAMKDHRDDRAALRALLPSWAQGAIIADNSSEFFLADSSIPISGLLNAVTWVAESDEAVRRGLGDRKAIAKKHFWDKVRGKESGMLPGFQSAVADMFKGGALASIMYPFAGLNAFTAEPIPEGQGLMNAVKNLAPGYITYGVGITEKIAAELGDQMKFNHEALGRRSSLQQTKHGDIVVGVINALLARKHRTIDPIWMARFAKKMAKGIPKHAKDEAKRLILNGASEDDIAAVFDLHDDVLDSFMSYLDRLLSSDAYLMATGAR